MKHVFYSAIIGLSALALNSGAMAENYSNQNDGAHPQAQTNVHSQNNEPHMGVNDNESANNQKPDNRSDATEPSAHAPNQVKLSQADITHTQRALKDEGFKVSVDGIWGPMTANAVAQFQQQNALPVTGRPDSRTLAALNIEANDNR